MCANIGLNWGQRIRLSLHVVDQGWLEYDFPRDSTGVKRQTAHSATWIGSCLRYALHSPWIQSRMTDGLQRELLVASVKALSSNGAFRQQNLAYTLWGEARMQQTEFCPSWRLYSLRQRHTSSARTWHFSRMWTKYVKKSRQRSRSSTFSSWLKEQCR